MKRKSRETLRGDILLVDDMFDNLRVLSSMLTEHGYKVRPVPDGHQALAAIARKAPDLILLDIMMPGMNGFEVCQRLKADSATHDIPVIFLSALDDVSDKVEAFNAGGVDYIGKPFQEQEVLARVNTHLTLRRQQQELLEERERFQKLADAAFEGILIHEEGVILEVNHPLAEMFGYDAVELIGKSVFEFLNPQSNHEAQMHLESRDEQPYELQALKRDGSVLPVEIHVRNSTWQGRAVRVLAVRDLSWRNVLEQERRTLRITLEGRENFGRLVGKSQAMRNIYESILRAAASDAPVMIYGETGTGKEVTARTIVDMSFHHIDAFVAVNCASIPENLFESEFFGHCKGAFSGAVRDHKGYFEQAQGGTLFLDEVGELPLIMQAKLLRVLEDHSYTPVGEQIARRADVRIIAATNKELRSLARQGKIRSDFFHRLHVLTIDLPPLRWRKDDLPLLIAYFFHRQNDSENPPRLTTLPSDLLERFEAYDWPGNVRELFNEMQRYLMTGAVELAGSLSDESVAAPSGVALSDDLPLSEIVDQVEHYYIHRTLERHGGHKTKVAQLLGLDRRTLYRKLEKYGLS